MPKKKQEPTEEMNVPVTMEESTGLGDIMINHTVVASIVRLATMEVPGVVSVGGGSMVEGITEFFSKKEAERGVRVDESEDGGYRIEVRVILKFGVDLAKTGLAVQEVVRSRVLDMTSKPASQIDVVIDGIKMDVEEKEEKEEGYADLATD